MKALPNTLSGTFPLPESGAVPEQLPSPSNTSGAGAPVALGVAADCPSGRVLAVIVYGFGRLHSADGQRNGDAAARRQPGEHVGSQVEVGAIGMLRASTFV